MDKSPIIEIYKGVPIRYSNVVRFRASANELKRMIDIAEATTLCIPDIVKASSQPCQRCVGIDVIALQMVTNNQVGFDGAMLAIETASVNYKFAYALLAMFRKQKEEEAAQQAEYAHQQQMQLLQMQNQIAMNLAAAKSQGTQQEIQVKGQVDNEVNQQLNQAKYQTQAALKQQTTESRIMETNNKLDKEHNLKNQDSIIAK